MTTEGLHFLTQAEIKKKNKAINIQFAIAIVLMLVSGLVGIVAFFMTILQSWGLKDLGINPEISGSFFFCSIIVMSILVLSGQTSNEESKLYSDIEQEECQDILELINATPEGLEFQKLVLAEGRKFIYYDFLQLENWTASEPDRKACKALYQIN